MAWLIHHADRAITVLGPYNAWFVDQLKLRIPPAWRAWQPDEKAWRIRPPYTKVATDLAASAYSLLHVASEGSQQQLSDDELLALLCARFPSYAALDLLPSAGVEVVQAAYRALAVRHHPDHGGGTKTMQRINAAYADLKYR